MESLVIWGITVAVIAIIVVPYAVRFRRRNRLDRERREEAIAMGAHKPTAQHPIIDELSCVGCGSCVAACPEGDVLGIVGGRAVIVNGLRCIGHGLCEKACPVGAITVGLADVAERDDIPVLDEHNQTTVPGIYIAGELGGFALIRNAILQGRQVVEHIASRVAANGKAQVSPHPVGAGARGPVRSSGGAEAAGSGGPASDDVDDIIVVGAGPAGITAALTAKQHGLTCRILDREDLGGTVLQYPRRKLVLTQPVEIPLYGALDAHEYTKERLLEIWTEIRSRHRLRTEVGQIVTDVKRVGDRFEVQATGGIFRGRFVVLALGRRGAPRKLGAPGEDLPKVMYRLLDAGSYHDMRILIVGGGDSAVEAAIALARQSGNTVTLSYRKPKLMRIKKRNAERVEPLLSSGEIEAEFESEVVAIGEKTVRLRTPAGEKDIPNDHVFIFAGGEPPFALLRKIGIAFRGASQSAAAAL